MKPSRAFLLLMASATLFFATHATAAEDGGALYKQKCAVCHGADAAGKPAMKAPSLISAEAKKMSDAEITDMIANGGKAQKPTHAFGKKGMAPEQIKAVVAFIRTLQK